MIIKEGTMLDPLHSTALQSPASKQVSYRQILANEQQIKFEDGDQRNSA